MKRKLFAGLLVAVISTTLVNQASVDVFATSNSELDSINTQHIRYVNIPDANLRKLLNERYLKQEADAEITSVQLGRLKGTLYLGASDISDITGLEYCKGVTGLYLGYNKITDITPLKNLKKLKTLNLINQKIDLGSTTINNNTVVVDNNLVNIDGTNIAPINSKEYSYDKATNTIKFDNVTSEGQKSYTFKQKISYGSYYTTYFSGTVTFDATQNN